MAFKPAQNTEPATQEREKAAKWVNVYLPTEDGTKLKIGAIPLNQSNATQAAVLELLSTPEGQQLFSDNIIIVVQDGAPERGAIKFKLG
jgi:hypothetical protein